MSVIKIPSKQIYSKPSTTSLKNRIKSISYNSSDISEEYGNILDKEYRYEVYKDIPNFYNPILNSKGEEFDLNISYYLFGITGTEYLKISKTAKIEFNSSNRLTSHKIIATLEWFENYYTTETVNGVENKVWHHSTFTEKIDITDKIKSFDGNVFTIEIDIDTYKKSQIGTGTIWLKSFTISCVGMYISAESTEHLIGSSQSAIDSPFLPPNNELVQSGEAYKSIMEKVLSKYKNGKDYFTIRVSVGEYYDYNTGELLISTKDKNKPMTFDIDDVVIPMLFLWDGTEEPWGLKSDESPKMFNVIDVKTYYDGAVWQDLSLQEIT